ncbi:hypothetical protein RGQ15_00325 [Paracoccus sp. MBLB3053]|uniref:Phage gp6-like head-tail connector protein n=1 Tax=Paracoccus aurantius TaxID=3073814 RepID=A0ABU2HLW4_9RHOB|nr:hypothetical protein [Paracoccus sp. MBLB3053]MDS9466021.1 hypothetical protein [Paracoccus sp. MBLB3053]
MMLVEMTAPPVEALPVSGLRAHLRLARGFEIADDSSETAALTGFLRAAMATVEARTGKVLLSRQFRMRLENWRDCEAQTLPLAPVNSIDRIDVDDGAGRVTVLDRESYRLVADLQRPILAPRSAFLPTVPQGGSVSVIFSAGFGTAWEAIPADLAQAVLLLAARYHEDRTFEGSQAAMPFGVSALVERWRSVRVLGGRGASRGRT